MKEDVMCLLLFVFLLTLSHIRLKNDCHGFWESLGIGNRELGIGKRQFNLLFLL
jgi:hypothetical protein